jgi:putrescine transport system permease protein
MSRRSRTVQLLCALGYAFVLAPLAVLVVYSFNQSPRVAVWTGFSTRWYANLLSSHELLAAAWTSLKVASISATAAIIVGTVAAYSLSRVARFRGRRLLWFSTTVPLVTPEVLLGFSLLLLFVAIGIPRGQVTVIIAHATLGAAFVSVIVRARLQDFDRSVEEAAADLGGSPSVVFALITLPMLAPALISGWLLAFVLSLDDLVIASFVNGPGTSTLPMVIFGRIRTGLSPEVNALATLMIVFVTVILALALGAQRRVSKRSRSMDVSSS